jgi:hypothetical protein
MFYDYFPYRYLGIHCMGDENSKSIQALGISILHIIKLSSLSLQVPLADL